MLMTLGAASEEAAAATSVYCALSLNKTQEFRHIIQHTAI